MAADAAEPMSARSEATAEPWVTVGEVDEAAVVAAIDRRFRVLVRERPWPSYAVGPGDDAALVPAGQAGVLVSTDAMGEGTDFLHRWPAGVRTRGHDVGFKAAAQNLSDINAMGGRATALVSAVSVPADTTVRWLADVAGGMTAAVRALGAERCRLAGGDLGTAQRAQIVVTALGDPAAAGVLRRAARPAPHGQDGAAPDELLLVHAGTNVGWAAAGLALLLTPRADLQRRHARLPADARPGAREIARAVRGQLRPHPPLWAGPAAAGRLVCALDVSDGLGRDATRLAEANGMTAWLDRRWVAARVEELARLGRLCDADPRSWVVSGGEDYGLLGAAASLQEVPEGFSVIGRLRRGGDSGPDGHERVRAEGWDHFG